jgi:hypothetical protein
LAFLLPCFKQKLDTGGSCRNSSECKLEAMTKFCCQNLHLLNSLGVSVLIELIVYFLAICGLGVHA